MDRLTYELGHKGSGSYEPIQNKDMPTNNYIACINKLGKLEDLEEEIGCPLDIVFKALTNGVYYGDNADWMSWSGVELHQNLEGDYVLYTFDEQCLFTKDYKKTWWLKKDKSE